MTNYGLPLRFRLTITRGPRVGDVSSVADMTKAVETNTRTTTGNKVLGRFNWEPSISPSAEVTPYQSTGHHDANGAEVFFGDMLLCPNEELWMVEFCEHQGIYLRWIDQHDYESSIQESPFWGEYIVVGNIHTPHDELQRRAQEVLNA